MVTSAPGLPCKHIMHIVAQEAASDWANTVIQCLKKAEKKGFKSIAFPALGTGN